MMRSAPSICGSSSATRIFTRRVGRSRPVLDAGSDEHHREAAARGVLGLERAAHPLDEALGQREPETDARRVVGVAHALERVEDLAPCARRATPGPVVGDPQLDRAAERAGAEAGRSSGGGVPEGVGQQVDERPLQQDRVGAHRRQVVRDVDLDLARLDSQLVEHGREDVLDVDRTSSETARTPACTRLTSSRLVTRSARPCEAVLGGLEQFRPGRRRESGVPAERRLVTAAVAAASGRRRSWPTAASSAVRTRSVASSGPDLLRGAC